VIQINFLFCFILGPEFRVTATFVDLEGYTRLNIEKFERVKTFCVEANEQNFDRLGEVLAGLTE
jgi:hypothetical protein